MRGCCSPGCLRGDMTSMWRSHRSSRMKSANHKRKGYPGPRRRPVNEVDGTGLGFVLRPTRGKCWQAQGVTSEIPPDGWVFVRPLPRGFDRVHFRQLEGVEGGGGVCLRRLRRLRRVFLVLFLYVLLRNKELGNAASAASAASRPNLDCVAAQNTPPLSSPVTKGKSQPGWLVRCVSHDWIPEAS